MLLLIKATKTSYIQATTATTSNKVGDFQKGVWSEWRSRFRVYTGGHPPKLIFKKIHRLKVTLAFDNISAESDGDPIENLYE